MENSQKLGRPKGEELFQGMENGKSSAIVENGPED
jgi:hypothetical protein